MALKAEELSHEASSPHQDSGPMYLRRTMARLYERPRRHSSKPSFSELPFWECCSNQQTGMAAGNNCKCLHRPQHHRRSKNGCHYCVRELDPKPRTKWLSSHLPNCISASSIRHWVHRSKPAKLIRVQRDHRHYSERCYRLHNERNHGSSSYYDKSGCRTRSDVTWHRPPRWFLRLRLMRAIRICDGNS